MAVISSAPQPRVASAKPIRSHSRLWRFAFLFTLLLGDLLAMNAAFVGVYLWRLPEIEDSGLLQPDGRSIAFFLLALNLIFLLTCIFGRMYDMRRGVSRVDEASRMFVVIALTTVLALIVNTLLPQLGFDDLPWTGTILALSLLAALVLTTLLRSIHRSVVVRLRRMGIDVRRVLIVGAREPGRAVWSTIRRMPELGYQVQGFLSDSFEVGSTIEDLPVLGRTMQLGRVVRATRADEIIIALSGRSQSDLLEIVALAEDESVAIKVYPDTFQLITNNDISVGDLSGLPLVSVKNAALDSALNQALKRGLDIVVSLGVLLVASPIMVLLAALIRLESKGPVFFLQERVGMDNRPFLVLKFRTMRLDSEASGPGWTTANDPRVTRMGKFLRRTSLDELPQFINVLIGDMSVVGPRPEQPRWVEQFSQQIPRYMRRHKEKAGITGWAQVNGLRGDTSIEERTRYDLYYIENWSLLFDIKIILRTTANFLTGKQENAY